MAKQVRRNKGLLLYPLKKHFKLLNIWKLFILGCKNGYKMLNKWGDDYFMRCAVYLRVSTDDQRDNGYSIDL